MNKIAAVILCLIAAGAFAQEKTDTTATAPKSNDSPLVRAAKAAGGPKRKPKAKVLTNADVKKSKGKLIILSPKNGSSAAASTAPASKMGPIEKHDEQLRKEKEAAARVDAAQKTVTELEKELRSLEDEYYAENDPNYRDNTIAPRFNQTKRQLEEARKALADARDAQGKIPKR